MRCSLQPNILIVSLLVFGPIIDSSFANPIPTAPYPETFSLHIVAVGDLHGDLQVAQEVLKKAGVTDDNHRWSGNVDIIVQLGDVTDR